MALWRIRATVDDRPGYLSVLTASLALRSVNILAVQVHTTEAGAVDDFLVDAPDTLTEADLHAAIERGRGRDAFVARAEAQGLVDQPTRVLALAGRLVGEPDSLGEMLVALLDATEVRWRPEPPVERTGFDTGRMRLVDPAGGFFEVLRDQPGFTPAEYARAQALVEVAGEVLRVPADRTTLLLPDGTELLIRAATTDDLIDVRALHKHRETTVPGDDRLPHLDDGLPHLLEPATGLTLLAETADHQLVAIATLTARGDQGELTARGDQGELTVLVDQSWQRRGIGTALLRRLLAHARDDFTTVIARFGADNEAMLRTMRRLGATLIEPAGPAEPAGLPGLTVPAEPAGLVGLAGLAEPDGAMVTMTVPIARPGADITPAST